MLDTSPPCGGECHGQRIGLPSSAAARARLWAPRGIWSGGQLPHATIAGAGVRPRPRIWRRRCCDRPEDNALRAARPRNRSLVRAQGSRPSCVQAAPLHQGKRAETYRDQACTPRRRRDLFTDWLDLRDRAAATAARPGPLVADHPGYGPLSPWPTAGRPGPGLTTDRRGQSGSAASHLCRRVLCGRWISRARCPEDGGGTSRRTNPPAWGTRAARSWVRPPRRCGCATYDTPGGGSARSPPGVGRDRCPRVADGPGCRSNGGRARPLMRASVALLAEPGPQPTRPTRTSRANRER